MVCAHMHCTGVVYHWLRSVILLFNDQVIKFFLRQIDYPIEYFLNLIAPGLIRPAKKIDFYYY